MNFVLPVRKGGLGNQMFQVAAAIVYQQEKQKTILLPDEFYNYHNTNRLDYKETVFKSFQHRYDKPIDDGQIHLLKNGGWIQHPGEPGFEEWKPIETENNILLHGYFQSYTSLQAHEELIREVYLDGLSSIKAEQLIQPSRQFVGIHVRRGDYLQHPASDVLPAQTTDYYKKALDHFNLQQHIFFIFSDDLAWCKEQDIFQSLPKKIFIDEPNEVICLALMTSCHGGFITANSTFSWWGAFLGADTVGAPVFVPPVWFKGGCGTLIPSRWRIL